MARYLPRSIWPKFCGSRLVPTLFCARLGATRLDARISETIAAPAIRRARGSSMDERSRVLEVLSLDRLGRPVGERRNGASRIVAGVLRKGARAHDEKVGNVPALQIAVEGAGRGVGSHDRAAAQVRRLVLGNVVGRLAGFLYDLLCAHRLDDFGELVGEIRVLLDLVVVEVNGHPHQRPAEPVL